MSNKTKKLKILHVTFNMGIGGTEQVIRQLVSGLPPNRFDNVILCIDGSVGETGKQLEEQGTSVVAFKRKPGFDMGLVRKMHRLIKEGGIDILHCHQYTPWVYGWLAARGTDTRVIFTEHGRFHPDHHRYKAVLVNPLMALMTQGVVAISKATRSALSQYEFVPMKRIEVIYNGIQPLAPDLVAVDSIRRGFGIEGSDFVLGTVARLDPVKNQILMLDAFAEVLKEKPNCWLLIVGDGPDRALLENKANELGVSGRTIFTGFIAQPLNYLAAMDVFLLSSHTEGTSMTLLEAMSLGIPAVVTNVGGNPEIVVDNKTGILTEPGSLEAFARSIKKLISDRAMLENFSRESRATFARAFSLERMIASYELLYERAISKFGY